MEVSAGRRDRDQRPCLWGSESGLFWGFGFRVLGCRASGLDFGFVNMKHESLQSLGGLSRPQTMLSHAQDTENPDTAMLKLQAAS